MVVRYSFSIFLFYLLEEDEFVVLPTLEPLFKRILWVKLKLLNLDSNNNSLLLCVDGDFNGD